MSHSDIFLAMEARLRSGELLPGSQILEARLMQEFAVSRTPVLPPAPPKPAGSSSGIPFIRVALDRLDIARIELGEPVLVVYGTSAAGAKNDWLRQAAVGLSRFGGRESYQLIPGRFPVRSSIS